MSWLSTSSFSSFGIGRRRRSFSRSTPRRSYSAFFAFFARSTSCTFFFTLAYFGFVTAFFFPFARTFTVPTFCF